MGTALLTTTELDERAVVVSVPRLCAVDTRPCRRPSADSKVTGLAR